MGEHTRERYTMPDMQRSQSSYESPRFAARVTEAQAPRATISLSLDHLIVHAADGSPAKGPEARALLASIAGDFDASDLSGATPFVERAGMRVSAPGEGRLTLTVGAFGNVECAEAAYLAFRDLIDPALSAADLSLVALGAYPGAGSPGAALALRLCVPSVPARDLVDLARALAPVLALLGDNTPRPAGAPRALAHACVEAAAQPGGTPAVDLRCADALPIDFALAYVTLVKQIFFRNKNRVVIGALLDHPSEDDCSRAVEAVRAEGFAAHLYGSNAGFWADELILLATNTARGAERAYLAPLSEMVANRFTLADAYEDPDTRRPEAQEAVHAKADETGAPRIGILPRYDFELSGLSLSRGYTKGVLAAGGFPVVLPLTDNPRILRKIVESCDGFIVPGGHDIAPETYGQRRSMHLGRTIAQRDAMELTLIPQILASGKPLLGICRGMQALNVACGGTLWQDLGDAFPHSSIHHAQQKPYTRPVHEVRIDPASHLAQIMGTSETRVNSIHHQAVREPGRGLAVAAQAPDGVIEAVEMSERPFVVGVQWHPEFLWPAHPEDARLFERLVAAAAAHRDAEAPGR